MFIENIFRSLLFFFDQIIYGFIPTVYDFITLLANTKLFSEGTIKNVSNNIYAIVGFFMLFIISFNLIKSIVDPDMLTDKDQGFGKVATRTIIAILLIVVIPVGFSYAWQLQRVIIDPNDSLISKAILGSSYESAGIRLSATALKAFIICDTSCTSSQQDNLAEAISDPKNLSKMAQTLNDVNPETGQYRYTYYALISTATGVVILIMLITFCFDVALRLVKMGFLQVLSPVAVVSYVDPSSAKDGIFSKWLKMAGSTYIGLFTRLASVTFMTLVLSKITDVVWPAGTTSEQKTWITIFIVIGALIFAKNAPKMLADLFNLQDEPMSSINPFKRMLGGDIMQKQLSKIGGKGVGLVKKGLNTAGKKAWTATKRGASNALHNARVKNSNYTADNGGYSKPVQTAYSNMKDAKTEMKTAKQNLADSKNNLSRYQAMMKQNQSNLESKRFNLDQFNKEHGDLDQSHAAAKAEVERLTALRDAARAKGDIKASGQYSNDLSNAQSKLTSIIGDIGRRDAIKTEAANSETTYRDNLSTYVSLQDDVTNKQKTADDATSRYDDSKKVFDAELERHPGDKANYERRSAADLERGSRNP